MRCYWFNMHTNTHNQSATLQTEAQTAGQRRINAHDKQNPITHTSACALLCAARCVCCGVLIVHAVCVCLSEFAHSACNEEAAAHRTSHVHAHQTSHVHMNKVHLLAVIVVGIRGDAVGPF